MRDIQVNNIDSRIIDANGESAVIDCAGFGSIGLDIRGTFTATLIPEGTIDNSNWTTLDASPLGGGAAVNSITGAGAWTINCAGLSQVRIRCSAYTSGTITVRMLASLDGGINNNIEVTLPAGTNLIGNVGHGKTIKTYSASITSDTDVIAAVASKRIKVIAYSIINQDNTADTVIFKSNGTGGTELWRVYLRGPDANTPFGANLSIPAPSFLFATVAGEKLTVDVSSGATLHISITYFDDDAT